MGLVKTKNKLFDFNETRTHDNLEPLNNALQAIYCKY